MNLAIITGGSKGLGQSLVTQFRENKWEVFELSRTGSSKHNIHCDLTKVDSVHNICSPFFNKLSQKQWKQIVFINNAADLYPIKSVADLLPNEINKNLSINQVSSFILISEFIKAFRNMNATKLIVNVSSGAALKGYAGWSLYCASKAASENFIKSLVLEEESQLSPFSAINYDPGIIDTDMQASIRGASVDDFPLKERFISYKENGDLKTSLSVAIDLVKLISLGVKSGERYSVGENG